jgi:CheY-like chemotaxis protein
LRYPEICTDLDSMPAAVLIVEDDPGLRDMLEQLLHLQGFAPITTANGREALDFLRMGGHADVILLDLIMPVMDGRGFRREQERDEQLSPIPVVVMSGVELPKGLHEAAWFPKPLDLPRLLETLRTICGMSLSG